ncbi:TRAP transporter substrate-binding protein [uncultured Sphaerochaeta sp.]|uniref:TRAP transporter substrate-binding protein n=1 Tax=uncultured Sphaerochaeta sp. TaxID=886478 RepID=UPI002A0A103B|nr:TRAP transporter substrate-binding protein [uncultured Sphaerochaeta sp.]
MKKVVMLVMLFLCLTMGMAYANGQVENAATTGPIEIKLAHENAVDQPIHRYSQLFADKVNQYTEGRVHITVYPAGQLGNMTDLTTNVSLGLMDMCIIDNSNLINYIPEYSMPSLPMMITSWDQAEKVFDSDMVAKLNERMASEYNIRILDWWWNGFRNMCSSKPIYKIADFKGVKFRSPGLDNYLTMFNLLGAKPTVIPWGETFSGFQTGIVDGMETTTEAIYSQSFYTLGKYIIMTRHLFSSNAPVINEKLWESIPERDRVLMQKAMDEATSDLRKEVISSEADYIKKLNNSGNVVIELQDKDKLVSIFTPYWNEFAKKNNCEDFLKFIIECGK